jgi:hypothetical protein
MLEVGMLKGMRWVLGCGWLLAGLGVISVWAGEPAAATIAVLERGLIITAEGIFPKELAVVENSPCSLWVINGTGEQGALSLQLPAPVVLDAQKNKATEIKVGPLASGNYPIQFKAGKAGGILTAVLHAGSSANTTTAQAIAIMAGYKQFKPEVTRIRANQPLIIYWYTASFIPHGDLELLGTTAKFKMKNKQIEIVELKSGLSAGVYPISRPGYPKQNHAIAARVVAE